MADTTPWSMLHYARVEGRVSDRQVRLFACGCVRRVWPWLTDEQSRIAVEVAERVADGWATRKELTGASLRAEQVAKGIERWKPVRSAAWAACWASSGSLKVHRVTEAAISAAVLAAMEAAAQAHEAEGVDASYDARQQARRATEA